MKGDIRTQGEEEEGFEIRRKDGDGMEGYQKSKWNLLKNNASCVL